jgi:DNA-binding beta-propeller fold protein YncE
LTGLRLQGHIELPAHAKGGGFDHAAVHQASSQLYVAHTSNDALDVVDSARDLFLRSIRGLKGVAGVLVSDERGLLFTANRGENTVSIFAAGPAEEIVRLPVGIRPNGLAFDPVRGLLLVANVGDPDVRNSSTVSMIDVGQKSVTETVVLPGRPRWALYDDRTAAFFVNIADPPVIAKIDAKSPSTVAERYEVPASGPHGLELDPQRRQLFCACDGGKLIAVHVDSGEVRWVGELSGPPDVVFLNPGLSHVYVAVGAPGVIDVFDARLLKLLETIPTEPGAHTLAIDQLKNKVYAFLPFTHRAAVYRDQRPEEL